MRRPRLAVCVLLCLLYATATTKAYEWGHPAPIQPATPTWDHVLDRHGGQTDLAFSLREWAGDPLVEDYMVRRSAA